MKLGARPVDQGAIIFRSGDQLYIVDAVRQPYAEQLPGRLCAARVSVRRKDQSSGLMNTLPFGHPIYSLGWPQRRAPKPKRGKDHE